MKETTMGEQYHIVRRQCQDYLESIESIKEQNENEEILQEFIDEISLKHPIMYDVYNLCEYYANAKLAKFSMQMLKKICSHLEIYFKLSSRKQELIDKIVDE